LPGRFARARRGDAGRGRPLRRPARLSGRGRGRFFGRAREIAALATRIRDTPLMAAVGPSGIGKSSLIRAGVVPALKTSGEKWDSLVVRPGRDPMTALAGLLAPLVGSSPTPVDDLGAQKELAKRLSTEPGYLGSALRSISRKSDSASCCSSISSGALHAGTDPATGARSRRRSRARPTTPRRRCAWCCPFRSDFLGRAAEDPHFMNELGKGLFFLGPPTADGLRER